jgi:hypothetical protein
MIYIAGGRNKFFRISPAAGSLLQPILQKVWRALRINTV